jgi:ribosomal protein S18 acetylase RimI-like enzyme
MVTIRSCKPEEIPEVLALWAAARTPAPRTPDTPVALQALCEEDPGALLVADFDQRIVGALIAVPDGWRGNMYRLAVDPAHRREGIARQLVTAGEARLRARRVTRVTALVDAGDPVATRVWEAAGYRQDIAIARFVRNL